MKLQLQNIANLFRNVRSRSIILVTGFILLFGLLYGVMHFFNKKEPVADASVQLKDSPTIGSVPGGLQQSPTADYQRLQTQQNLEQAENAEKTGASSIPTLLDSNQFEQNQHPSSGVNNCYSSCNPCCNECAKTAGAGMQPGSSAIAALQPSQLRSGTLIYDMQGKKVIGHLGVDGKVRDNNGHVIGQVGPDGLVRSVEDGSVMGSAAVPAMGDAVYDAAGRLIGTISREGKVRDAHGHVIGLVGTDGIARNLKGAVIGKVSNPKVFSGVPVYDAQGHLLGNVGADGKVRDASGKVLGSVGADGIVRNAEGDIIGRAYLRGTSEKRQTIPGTPAYNNQGKLLGTLDSDGHIRDANGTIIGKVDSDGLVRGLDDEIIGKLGATAPGVPVYDKQGNLVGTVGSDGVVRDAQGKALGRLRAGGIVRDIQGNELGNTTAPRKNVTSSVLSATPEATVSLLPENTNPNPELQAILDRQAQQISTQKAEQLQQQMQASMSTQAGQLFAAWTSPSQQYVAGNPNVDKLGVLSGTMISSGSVNGAPVVKAGTIMYAVLLTSINSDEPGPVLAEIVQGKFKGARLLGTLSNQGKKVLLAFNTLTLPKLSESIAINTVGIDENTARTALSSYTDNHYWLRYGTLFASAFIQGYGQSFINSAPNYNISLFPPPTPDQPVKNNLNPRDRVFVGLGQVGLKYSQVLGNIFNTPPTVHVYSGTPMGILFLSDLAALPNS